MEYGGAGSRAWPATPLCDDAAMARADNTSSTSVTSKFAAAARVLSEHARRIGLVAPGFRCPPRIIGVDRTIRRSADGSGGVVAVRVAHRPFTATVADMIEGVVVINKLTPPEADQARDELWRVMLAFTAELFSSNDTGSARVA